MPSQADAQLLGGAVANRGRVFRVGDTVRRPVAPYGRATHSVLRQLASAGFTGSPRLLGADDRTESLSWIEGHAAGNPLPDWALGEDTLESVAVLVRGFHQAVSSYEAAVVAEHQWPTPVPPIYQTGTLSHNDLHPGNIIFADGRAVGLIDFDLAGPGGIVWDLATLIRCWAPLVADADLPGELADRPDRRFERAALLLDAYGLAGPQRLAVIDALVANHDWTYRIVAEEAGSGHPGFAEYWVAVADQTARARSWLVSHRDRLRAAVGAGS
ncbi:MAG: phosphotransferase [Actinomycetota bacterium]|nr:phosphotransferase [Actinomycetota bacterium]MDQ2956975.1 phosphotransferase [Actinomycetota bacterium]